MHNVIIFYVLFYFAETTKKNSYIFEEDMKLFVLLGVHSGLKQRHENVLQHVGKTVYQLLGLENVTETHKIQLFVL